MLGRYFGLRICTVSVTMTKYSVGRDDPGAPPYKFRETTTNKKASPRGEAVGEGRLMRCRMRSIRYKFTVTITPHSGYTSSGTSCHLLLKEKALVSSVVGNVRLYSGAPRSSRPTGYLSLLHLLYGHACQGYGTGTVTQNKATALHTTHYPLITAH